MKAEQKPADTGKPLSPIELATRWGCTRQHVYDLVREGRLQVFRLGRHLRIPASEVTRIESAQ